MNVNALPDSFRVGIPEIDTEHCAILDAVEAVESAIASQNAKLRAERLDALLDLVETHFEAEENLLRKHGFPGLVSHVIYHGMLMRKVKGAAARCNETTITPESDAYLLTELMKFIVDDILRGDMMFKSFLEDKGMIKVR